MTVEVEGLPHVTYDLAQVINVPGGAVWAKRQAEFDEFAVLTEE